MIELIHKHPILIKVLLAVVTITFILGGWFISMEDKASYAAKVGKEKITMQEYQDSVYRLQEFYRKAYQGAVPEEVMKKLDLRVFETMDYSEGATVEGNSDLPPNTVDMYYQGMPEAIGFVNGYAPSYTFTVKNGKPFISYDYYLSPVRPEADAVADLQELARINPKRPYFLLVHIRESSDIKRVKGILERLGPEFEVVPLDVFLTMAGKEPTFKERFRDPSETISRR